MLIPDYLRTDWRDPRDWRHPWRDRPGYWWCCCKKSAPSSAPAGIRTVCCSLYSLPKTLHVTFSNSGNCTQLDGQTFAVNWEPCGTHAFDCFFGGNNHNADAIGCWYAEFGSCTEHQGGTLNPLSISVACITLGGVNQWAIANNLLTSGSYATSTFSCNPLNASITSFYGNAGSCCTTCYDPVAPGFSLTATITE